MNPMTWPASLFVRCSALHLGYRGSFEISTCALNLTSGSNQGEWRNHGAKVRAVTGLAVRPICRSNFALLLGWESSFSKQPSHSHFLVYQNLHHALCSPNVEIMTAYKLRGLCKNAYPAHSPISSASQFLTPLQFHKH